MPTIKDILKSDANLIRHAATESFNTAERVGKLFIDIIDAFGSIEVIRSDNNTAVPSDDNVFSALKTLSEFISKTKDDEALGKISFKGGAVIYDNLQFGSSFSSGPTGFGGKITENADGELNSLTLRSWLEVPEIRYNRAEVILGDQWRAPGGGIIEKVEPDTLTDGTTLRTGTITLKLEDNEIGAIAVDDICKGYFHNFEHPGMNATEDVDDSRGNTHFSGFCTVFFRVTEMLDSDGLNKRFRYMIRAESERWPYSFHPFEGMHFVAYGNFNNPDRQKSAYETRTYTRHLVDVHDWEFSAYNIAMQFGDLSNLSVFGLDMVGYSAYLNNIYMTGTIVQTGQNVPVRIELTSSTGDWFLGYGEKMTITATVSRGWEDITPSVTKWEIIRDSGDPVEDAAWGNLPKVKNFNGSIEIDNNKNPILSDLGRNTAYSASTLFTIRAEGEYGETQIELTI